MSDLHPLQRSILHAWFGDEDDDHARLTHSPTWWQKSAPFDAMLTAQFGDALRQARAGELEHWRETPHGCLAYVILLDQFSRNIHRGTPDAFAADAQALAAATAALDAGFDRKLSYVERTFLAMPLMHSEDRDIQGRSLSWFRRLLAEAPASLTEALSANLGAAQSHANIIFRFGRYPHRNEILGRASTPAERQFLTQPNSSF